MRYLFVTWDGGGNLAPELHIARRLAGRGHDVRFLGHASQQAVVTDAGCGFTAFERAPDCDQGRPERALIRDWEPAPPTKLFAEQRDRLLFGPAAEFGADVLATVDRHPVDVVAVDFLLLGALAAAERSGVPAAALWHTIYSLPTVDVPPFGPGWGLPRGWPDRLRQRAMRAMGARLWRKGLPALNAARQGMGLAPLATVFQQFDRLDRVLVLTSPSFDFAAVTGAHLPANVRYVGPQVDLGGAHQPVDARRAPGRTRRVGRTQRSGGLRRRRCYCRRRCGRWRIGWRVGGPEAPSLRRSAVAAAARRRGRGGTRAALPPRSYGGDPMTAVVALTPFNGNERRAKPWLPRVAVSTAVTAALAAGLVLATAWSDRFHGAVTVTFPDGARAVTLPTFGERGSHFLVYDDDATLTLSFPLHADSPIPVTVTDVRLAAQERSMLQIQHVTVDGHQLPARLEPGDSAAVTLTARYDNCRYYHEREIEHISAAVVRADVLVASVTREITLDHDLVVHSPTIVDCPGRTLTRDTNRRLPP